MMASLRSAVAVQLRTVTSRRLLHQHVPTLSSTNDIDAREFSTPVVLPAGTIVRLPAAQNWFKRADGAVTIDEAWFAKLPDIPVEVEATEPDGRFAKSTVPLSFFLSFLNMTLLQPEKRALSLYMAQFPIPDELRPSLPLPSLLKHVSLSNSTMWLGITPTRTPLHEDSNHNILHQLAGSKTVRLLEPDRGKRVFEHVRRRLGRPVTKFRGEEMMSFEAGSEGSLLEDAVWRDDFDGVEARIHPGESLFIPQGWWHAVRGLSSKEGQEELVASVNWWYR